MSQTSSEDKISGSPEPIQVAGHEEGATGVVSELHTLL